MPGLGTGQQAEAVNGREDAAKGVKWADDGENATAPRSVKFQQGNIRGDEQNISTGLVLEQERLRIKIPKHC
jgi:hypothetical protein